MKENIDLDKIFEILKKEEDMDAFEKTIAFAVISKEITLKLFEISGNTFPFKEEIKKLGCKWNPESKTWKSTDRHEGLGGMCGCLDRVMCIYNETL